MPPKSELKKFRIADTMPPPPGSMPAGATGAVVTCSTAGAAVTSCVTGPDGGIPVVPVIAALARVITAVAAEGDPAGTDRETGVVAKTPVATVPVAEVDCEKQESGVLLVSYPQVTCFPPQYARPFAFPSPDFRQVHPDGHGDEMGFVPKTVVVTVGFIMVT